MDLLVLYEDNHLLVVLKPSGILSQEDYTKDQDMLNICKKYLKEKYQKSGNVYLGLVHRLDRNTSGIMVFAKTSKAASRLSMAMNEHLFKKKYLCVVSGKIPLKGILKDYLKKDEAKVQSFVTNQKDGKLAILDYQKLGEVDNNSVVLVNLHTGRHHQIRVQFANFGHPLVGDILYGGKNIGKSFLLHAYFLSFPHPITKEIMEFKMYPSSKDWVKFNHIICDNNIDMVI